MWTMHCPNMSWIHKFNSDFKWLNNIYLSYYLIPFVIWNFSQTQSIWQSSTKWLHHLVVKDKFVQRKRVCFIQYYQCYQFSLLCCRNIRTWQQRQNNFIVELICSKTPPFSSLPDSQVSDGKLVPQEDYKNDYTHVGFTHMNVKDWIDKINSILI